MKREQLRQDLGESWSRISEGRAARMKAKVLLGTAYAGCHKHLGFYNKRNGELQEFE